MIVGVRKRIPFTLPGRALRRLVVRSAQPGKEARPQPERESALDQFERMLGHTVGLAFRDLE